MHERLASQAERSSTAPLQTLQQLPNRGLMPARNRPARISTDHREHVQAVAIIKRLNRFALADPDNPQPGDVRMTRTQAFVALALLRKVMPDLASVEVSGNPDRPLMVQVVRFSDDAVGAGAPLLDAEAIEVELPSLEAAE